MQHINHDGASISGGNGGNGGDGGDGNSGFPFGGRGGNGGDGGDGFRLGAGNTLTNNGTIAGGNGGAGGAGGQGHSSQADSNGTDGVAGVGGVGIRGESATIINSGQIAGGFSGSSADEAGRSAAIILTGGNNSLELHAGFDILGDVIVSGGSNTLALGGTDAETFDVGEIGSQYQGFTEFNKIGGSTWTLTGSTTDVTSWILSEGTLSVSSDANLGAASGGLTFVGGVLATTANITSGREVTLTGDGGFEVADGTSLTLSGTVGGGGGLVKTGGGALSMTGDVSVERLRVQDGALNLVGNSVSIGDGLFGIFTNGVNAAVNVNDAEVTGSGDLFSALQGGSITIQGGTLTANADGAGSAAVYAQAGSTALQGTELTTTGNNAYGVRVDDDGSATITDSKIRTSGDSSFGVVGYQITKDRPVTLDITGTTVETSGSKAHGIFAANQRNTGSSDGAPADSDIRFASGSIRTHGPDAAGVYVRDSVVSLKDSSVRADQSNALAVATGGVVTVSGGELVSGAATVAVEIAPDKDATVTLAGGVDATRNDGALMLVSRASGGQGTATLILDSGAIASGVVADLSDGAGETNLEINDRAHYTGQLIGLDRVSLDGGTWSFSGAQDFGALVAGAGGGTLEVGEGETMFDAPLSGSGNLSKSGLGTLSLIGNSAGFSGTMSVGDGKLVVNGTLGGTMLVSSGGTLGGTGRVGSVTIEAGGIHAPGNSIGTQTIAGDYVNHGIFRVDGNPTATDRLIAKGDVDITGATLDLLLTPNTAEGWSVVNGPFTLISKESAGAVAGTFGKVENNLIFLNHSLDYAGGDGNDVTLELTRNDISFKGLGRTRNQRAAAGALDGLPVTSALWNAIALITSEDAARRAFDQSSGEVHASVSSGLIEDSAHVRNAANDRIRSAFAGVGSVPLPVMAYGPDGVDMVPPSSGEGFAVWSQAFGSWGSFDSDGNAAELDTSTGGLLVGGDAMLGAWRVGLLAGYSHSSLHADARISSADAESYHLGVYGGTEWGNLAFRSGLAYTWHDIETNRSVVIGGFADRLSADYDAGAFQAFGELGYKLPTPAAAFEPFVNLAHVSLNTDGFTERGGAAALTSGGETTDTTFTTLGVRASTDFALGAMNATARGMIGWRHAFGDTTPLSTHAFAGSSAFTVAGVPIAENSAVLEAGIDLGMSDMSKLGISYEGQFGSSSQRHGFNANLNVRF